MTPSCTGQCVSGFYHVFIARGAPRVPQPWGTSSRCLQKPLTIYIYNGAKTLLFAHPRPTISRPRRLHPGGHNSDEVWSAPGTWIRRSVFVAWCQQMEVGQPVYRGKKWEEPKRQFWKVMETLSLTILHLTAREQAPRFTLRQCHFDFGHPRTLWPTSWAGKKGRFRLHCWDMSGIQKRNKMDRNEHEMDVLWSSSLRCEGSFSSFLLQKNAFLVSYSKIFQKALFNAATSIKDLPHGPSGILAGMSWSPSTTMGGFRMHKWHQPQVQRVKVMNS